jgi:hypothetical protein
MTQFMKSFPEGFKANNHAELLDWAVADELSWDWSDGTKGNGSKADIFGIFAKSWGFMVGQMIPTGALVTIDPDNSKICISCTVNLLIDGGLPEEKNLVSNNIIFLLTVNQDMKITAWDGIWNNKFPAMLEALGAVSAKLQGSGDAK